MIRLVDEFYEIKSDTLNEHRLMILDGIIGNQEEIEQRANGWCLLDNKLRYLVVLSSEGAKRRYNDDNVDYNGRALFRQWSWRLTEYKVAMSNSAFFSSVAESMDAPEEFGDDPIDAKFFFAGGCARYMFGFGTELVKSRIDEAILEHHMALRGGSSSPQSYFALGYEHRLFSFFGLNKHEILSEYVKQKLMQQYSSSELKALANHSLLKSQRQIVGCLFELYFKRNAVDTKTVNLISFNGSENRMRWEIDEVREVHFSDLNKDNCPLDTLLWPLNQQEPTIGGLILREKIRDSGTIRVIQFLQVTVADTHKADLGVLASHLGNIGAEEAEFYFCLPQRPTKFTVTPIINKTALVKYGWPDDVNRIREQFAYVMIPGWET